MSKKELVEILAEEFKNLYEKKIISSKITKAILNKQSMEELEKALEMINKLKEMNK